MKIGALQIPRRVRLSLVLLALCASCPSAAVQAEDAQHDVVRNMKQILAATEDVWSSVFKDAGKQYVYPTMVIYRDGTHSGCGTVRGVFYCAQDKKIYLDVRFFEDLTARSRTSDGFAPAYVIAHEVGHHLQNVMGIVPSLTAARSHAADPDRFTMAVELQADCFAGVWAYHVNKTNRITRDDIEEAMAVLKIVSGDQLHRTKAGGPVPDTFRHGTSEQRVDWFLRGWRSGETAQCDTFQK